MALTETNERGTAEPLLVGIDVGSTTVKIAVVQPNTHEILMRRYVRHHAKQAQCLRGLLEEVKQRFGETPLRAALCGSGAAGVGEALGLPFVQEVVANALAIDEFYPNVRTAVELGGQDAKMIFFGIDEANGTRVVSDMRMNGSCAGGTGAFLDEIATLLKVPVEEFGDLAAQGSAVHPISGRCGVYAKTDIQPLLNQGVPKQDIALSSYHAIAKQTIGGLAQGLEIKAPIIFEGGPLTFNPGLVSVFAERLDLRPEEVIIPEHPETIVAVGAALSLQSLFADEPAVLDLDQAVSVLKSGNVQVVDASQSDEGASKSDFAGKPFFSNDEGAAEFKKRHALPAWEPAIELFERNGAPEKLRVYLGVDCGSTTTKLVLLSEDGELLDSFYASNEGEPIEVGIGALKALHRKYAQAGCELEIAGCGTTGYGEMLFANALGADCHMVETVAHAFAAKQCEPNASFILDIGGQDMKAIWVSGGVITNVVVNEACSSGCGSFLENFAKTLQIPTAQIADAAFSSKTPADLGSRCTVFMNSRIVSEQRNGKTPQDIMAGLCRSIVENVFTKVIRVSNLDSLGDRIVVQGGTFLNDAVLRAFEQYVGKQVTRAPHPGLMGAIGAAMIVRNKMINASGARRAARGNAAVVDTGVAGDGPVTACEGADGSGNEGSSTFAKPPESNFIGWEALENFSYTQESNLICPFCANHCSRTSVTFSNGSSWVTGNRCERGEVLGNPKDAGVREKLRAVSEKGKSVANLYDEREKLLLKDWPCEPVLSANNTVVGIPRVLSTWEVLPFWKTLLQALGFTVKLSRPSTREMYERGLSAVTSDTVCFPAKLTHGHLRDLKDQGVDRIFMPIVTTVPSENTSKDSQSMCAVVKGYSLVVQNSDNPQRRWGIKFDNPLFHWFTPQDCKQQLQGYFKREFGINEGDTARALDQAINAYEQFRATLTGRGAQVLEQARETGGYVVVLAGRPYHNDTLVNHDLPSLFTEQGIAVVPADAIAQANQVDLSNSLIDIVNNYHARMLATSVLAAGDPCMEFVQVVSFGCGHDAYLSDEIVRLMDEASGGMKAPLVLKIDESDARGPLSIRVRSFIETVNERRANQRAGKRNGVQLSDPYPQKFTKEDARTMTVLVPNTSKAFSKLMTAAFKKQGLRAVSIPLGRERAIELGKRYVHNDICFPAQIVIGEALAALESGEYDLDHVAVATGKYIGDCRLTHYAALLRKALDDAGYTQVPIVTNDDVDFHNIHPGFKMNIGSALRIAVGLPMIDAMEELLRKIRPYELVAGSAEAAFDAGIDAIMQGMNRGVAGMKRGFKRAIGLMKEVAYDRSNLRPTVLIVGEFLLNFHPGANHDIEKYLEANGLEVIEARMTDVIRKTYFYQHAQQKEFKVHRDFGKKMMNVVSDHFFTIAHNITDKIATAHPLYEPPTRMPELVKASDPIIHHTFDAGEGVLIPAEILHHAKKGCRNFVILQPFGCLPNHVVGRGVSKRLKELYPDAQILPLDFDPDVSFANVENRLQMLIMNARKSQLCAS